jgi:hypothetical protein
LFEENAELETTYCPSYNAIGSFVGSPINTALDMQPCKSAELLLVGLPHQECRAGLVIYGASEVTIVCGGSSKVIGIVLEGQTYTLIVQHEP